MLVHAVPDYQICRGNVLKLARLQSICATVAQMRFVLCDCRTITYG